jgi:RHS repeat-associated protein
MTASATCASREVSRIRSVCRGEQFDSDLGLYYLRARYYNPATGRFMGRDPEDGEITDPKTLHRYVYAGGDPVNGLDPSGKAELFEYLMNQDFTGRSATTTFILRKLSCMAVSAFTKIALDLNGYKRVAWMGGISYRRFCMLRTYPRCVGVWDVILRMSLDTSGREEMALLNAEMFARRWPYVLFVLVSALLFLTFVLVLSTTSPAKGLSLPFLVVLFCLIVYAGEWGEILRARLAAVGLPHSRWVIGPYASLVCIACFLLCYFISKGRFLAPGLFVLLHLPLVILKEKPTIPVALP